MKYHFSTLLFLLFTFSISAQQKVPANNIIPMDHSVRPQEKLTLWYDQPSDNWMDLSLPIGNGLFHQFLAVYYQPRLAITLLVERNFIIIALIHQHIAH